MKKINLKMCIPVQLLALILVGCGGGGGGSGAADTQTSANTDSTIVERLPDETPAIATSVNPVPDAGISETDADLPPDEFSTLLSDQVVTPQGTLQGVIEGSLSVFRGVRYAAAPVDNLIPATQLEI